MKVTVPECRTARAFVFMIARSFLRPVTGRRSMSEDKDTDGLTKPCQSGPVVTVA
jgi:hypothetical protein